MTNRFLIRPEVKRKQRKASSSILPVDLAAGYACYHSNLAEQRKLEQKLHVIDLETSQMNKNNRQQREVLEKEIKQNENYYFWGCHRVFSAATLITESDSYKKQLYTGPRPTKAKLPRKTLQRLNQLIQKLQAEDDLETLSKFQQCARFAKRETHPLLRSSSSLGAANSELDLSQTHRFAMDEESALSIGRSIERSSGKVKRVRSAPSRVASDKIVLANYKKGRKDSPFPRQRTRLSDVTSRYPFFKDKETSNSDFCTGDMDGPPTKLAWAEEERVIIDDEVKDADIGDSDLAWQQQSQLIMEKSSDIEKWVANVAEYHSSQSIITDTFDSDLVRYQSNLSAKPCEEYHQSDETTTTEEKTATDSKLWSTGVIFSPELEGKTTDDTNLNVDQPQVDNVGYKFTPTAHTESKPKRKSFVPVHQIKSESKDSKSLPEQKAQKEESLPSTICSTKAAYDAATQLSQSRLSERELVNTKHVIQSEENRNDNKYNEIVNNFGKRETECNRKRFVPKAQPMKSSVVSITFPKSDLQGLSSRRKTLNPRTYYKHSKAHCDNFKQEQEIQREQRNSLNTTAGNSEAKRDSLDLEGLSSQRKSLAPQRSHNKLSKLQNDACQNENEVQRDKRKSVKTSTGTSEAKRGSLGHDENPSNEQKKRKVSIFKRKCLSDVLYSAQTQIESRLRNRVQGFLTVRGDVEKIEEID